MTITQLTGVTMEEKISEHYLEGSREKLDDGKYK